MRIHELFEAPISDFEWNDDENARAFSKVDQRILRSEKARNKVVRMFRHTPFDFRVVVSGGTGLDGEDDDHNWEVDTLAGAMDSGIHDQLTVHTATKYGDLLARPDCITVLVISNMSPLNNKMPFTAWTLGHKIGHAFQDGLYHRNPSWDSEIGKIVKEINKAIYVISYAGEHTFDDASSEFNPNSTNVPFTMKSARDNKINNGFEVFPECVAQFLINGKVSVQPNSKPVVEFATQKLNELLYRLFQQTVGKIIVAV